MSQLVLKMVNDQPTVDSREVARLVNKEHKNLIRDIRGYIDILEGSNLSSQKFFIESTYINIQNKVQPCYLLTRKGCDMVANKLTGEKGVLFTAEYVTRFEEMEQVLKKSMKPLSPMDQLKLQYQVLEEHQEKLITIESKVISLENNMTIDYGQQLVLQELAKAKAIKEMGGKENYCYRDRSLRSKVFSSVWKDFKDYLAVNSYRNTAKKDFDKAKEYLKDWKAQGKLLREIEEMNSQIVLEEIACAEQ
ncbi:Rha family transcriptional regulator [Clostridium tetani]|uniref:Antirepressor n=1 Tax=Clostridium tetani TaxID=1513 RepID=A0ABC8ECZ7_CLOTA|nr:ORF6C domain-containing protein [Clostridium tetani]BDR81063.1 antirepressor [Clostridium tetani]